MGNISGNQRNKSILESIERISEASASSATDEGLFGNPNKRPTPKDIEAAQKTLKNASLHLSPDAEKKFMKGRDAARDVLKAAGWSKSKIFQLMMGPKSKQRNESEDSAKHQSRRDADKKDANARRAAGNKKYRGSRSFSEFNAWKRSQQSQMVSEASEMIKTGIQMVAGIKIYVSSISGGSHWGYAWKSKDGKEHYEEVSKGKDAYETIKLNITGPQSGSTGHDAFVRNKLKEDTESINEKEKAIDDNERELWVDNDEGLHKKFVASGLHMDQFISKNKRAIDKVISHTISKNMKRSNDRSESLQRPEYTVEGLAMRQEILDYFSTEDKVKAAANGSISEEIKPSKSYSLTDPDGKVVAQGSKRSMHKQRKAKGTGSGWKVWFHPMAKMGDTLSNKVSEAAQNADHIKIAKRTLAPSGYSIADGMSKDQAKKILKDAGWSDSKIRELINVKEDVEDLGEVDKKKSSSASVGWKVLLKGKQIDTVYYVKGAEAAEIKQGLINHDGYDSGITVVKESSIQEVRPGSPVDIGRKREAQIVKGITKWAKKNKLGELGPMSINSRGEIEMIQKVATKAVHPADIKDVPEFPDAIKKLADKHGARQVANRWIYMDHFAWENLLIDVGIIKNPWKPKNVKESSAWDTWR